LFAVEKILERFGDSISLESLFDHYDAETLALYSSEMAYPNLLRAAIRNDSKALSVKLGETGLTLLHVAINEIEENNKLRQMLMEERKKVITTLIEGGLDVDARCISETTALHLASQLNDDVTGKILLDRGANINLTDELGQNALHLALTNFKLRVNMELVKLLIDKGIDMEARNLYGATSLFVCCTKGHYDALVILLENGASVNAKNYGNRSPLHTAVFMRNYNCVKVLLDHGADINAVFDVGKTVLHAAFEGTPSPDVEVIKLLLSRGVDANKRDRYQQTALDHAVTHPGSYDLVKILFDATTHGQLVSTDYVTFLHYAVYQGNCFAVNLFLKDEPDLDKIDVNNEEYPLYFAVENQHLRSDLLLKMTKFIQDCKKKRAIFRRRGIVMVLKKDFSNGYGSDCVSFFLR
jgi:ankyrin repeat protein